MSLSRAFTGRRAKNNTDLDHAKTKERSSLLQRSRTTKGLPVRNNISAPMELVHTTNMLSYNAPDIRRRPAADAFSNSSTRSSDEETGSVQSPASSPPTSPDVTPHDLSQDSYRLSCYFVAPDSGINSYSKSQDPGAPPVPPAFTSMETPAVLAVPCVPRRVPQYNTKASHDTVSRQRAPSHIKKASHETLSRQRSLSQMSRASHKSIGSTVSTTFSTSASSGSNAASTIHQHSVTPGPKAPVPPSPRPEFEHQQPRHDKSTEPPHPFGRELAQVTEMAEELGTKSDTMLEEECALKAEGFCKFTAEDYLSEVQSLFSTFFVDKQLLQPCAMTAAWI